MYYFDTNAFVAALGAADSRAVKAQGFLQSVAQGASRGATSALALDEVLWVLLRKPDRAKALQAVRDIMRIPNLEILPVTAETISRAMHLLDQHARLKPRDAIHAASALQAGYEKIVSDDSDFDTIRGIARIRLDA